MTSSIRARNHAGWLALAALIAWFAFPAGLTRAQSGIILSIVGTNDLHGAVADVNEAGGLPLLGGYLRNLRAARDAGGGVLLVDAGDLFQGSLESNLNEGAVVVSAYNALGYSAATIGNHEFDFGPAGPPATPQTASDDPRGALKARAAEARFPFLTGNIIERATARPVSWPNVHPLDRRRGCRRTRRHHRRFDRSDTERHHLPEHPGPRHRAAGAGDCR